MMKTKLAKNSNNHYGAICFAKIGSKILHQNGSFLAFFVNKNTKLIESLN